MSIADMFLQYSKLGNGHQPTSSEKWWCSFILGILFALISSSFVYGITNGIFGMTWTEGVGGPTIFGLLLHTLVFILIIRLLLA